MVGVGSPVAVHLNSPIVPCDIVWVSGSIRTVGGGLSIHII